MQNRIKEVRENLSLTQEDFGKLFGVSDSSIGNWENNYSDIPLSRLIEISNRFNLSLDYLTCLDNTNKKYQPLKEVDYKALGKRLKELRRSKRATQEDFALIAGIASGSYSRYERAVSHITGISLYCICKKYNVSMDDVLGRKLDNQKN